ncbi:MAG: hypothetical protein SNI70_06955 [Rikenellaceae bacterium]
MENLVHIKADGIYLIKGDDLLSLAKIVVQELMDEKHSEANCEGIYRPISMIKGLDTRTYNALYGGGCRTIKDIIDKGEHIRGFRFLGSGSIRKLQASLKELGYDINYRGL